MKKRININVDKIKAFMNFERKVKEQYKVLKTVKMVYSKKDYDISFMKNEFYNHRKKKNDEIVEVDEKNGTENNKKIDFDEGDSYDDDNKYDLDDEDIDDYSDKMRKKNQKIKKENNKIIETEANNEGDNKDSNNNYFNYNNDDNRAKSK
jgi:hypothetical protein